MSSKLIKLRAHHGMCLAFFRGEGYSNSFSEHMAEIKRELQGNPKLQLLAETDVICEKCPNLILEANGESSHCNTPLLVKGYDQAVLDICGLKANSVTDWQTFSTLVEERILHSQKRIEICGNCQWNDLCSM